MANEVRVTTSQADAAKMIVERNSANGKPTPEAIRKISEAEADPGQEPDKRQQSQTAVSGRKGRLRSFLARLSLGTVILEGAGVKIRPQPGLIARQQAQAIERKATVCLVTL